jgi:MFS transporter, DHA2 family, multidrug resistance protein
VREFNPWIVALAFIIRTFMEVLDTTNRQCALRYMAGGLSAPSSDSEWVSTSYLAAMPYSSHVRLASVSLGRRRYFLISIAVFTLASVKCGMAISLEMLIASRVLQRRAGGGLQPSSQGVLLDAFPPEKQGVAMT